jgi:hypothetical protein
MFKSQSLRALARLTDLALRLADPALAQVIAFPKTGVVDPVPQVIGPYSLASLAPPLESIDQPFCYVVPC